MNIRHLEILEAIEQTGSFTGAAKELHLTQSAVSHAIAELEKQTETPLFERLPRGVRLTNCGLLLLEESRTILTACRNLDKKIASLEKQTPINIVSSITISSFLLPQILTRVKNINPSISLNVKTVSATAAVEILKNGEADIAFWEGIEPTGTFKTIKLGSYKLTAACSPDFPLEHYTLSYEDLCSYPLLLREHGSAIRDAFDNQMAIYGINILPVWESVNSLSLIKAAEAGLGITILPETLLSESFSQNKLIPIILEGSNIENKMLAVLLQDKYITSPLKLLLDVLDEYSS